MNENEHYKKAFASAKAFFLRLLEGENKMFGNLRM